MPIKESITIKEALEVLNRAVAADPVAMKTLIGGRVDCNQALADDETIQVRKIDFGASTSGGRKCHQVGFLGVLNGLFGINDEDGFGAIVANFNVWCDRECETPNEGKKVGDQCEACGNKLRLGDLTHFSRVE